MKDRLMRFMAGRYGNDPLNQVILGVSLVLVVVSLFWSPPYVVALALMVYSLFRMFSRNLAARGRELAAYERAKARVAGFFFKTKNRLLGSRSHRYFRCPGCRQQMRAPRKKGKISVTCPKCQTTFITKT